MDTRTLGTCDHTPSSRERERDMKSAVRVQNKQDYKCTPLSRKLIMLHEIRTNGSYK